MARLRSAAEPGFYGDDRETVHIVRTVNRASIRPVSGYCWDSRLIRNGATPPTLTLAPGRSVTCPACLAHANRLAH